LAEAKNRLEKIEHSSKGEKRTVIKIYNQSAPNYEIFENLKAKILIIKLRDTVLGSFPTLQTFNDPLVTGIQIQQIDTLEYWVKIRTKIPHLNYKISSVKGDKAVLNLEIFHSSGGVFDPSGPKITDILRELNPRSERLVIYLNKLPQFDILKKSGGESLSQVRFLDTELQSRVIVPDNATKIIKNVNFVQKGKYLFMEIIPQNYALKITAEVVKNPIRVLFKVVEDHSQSLAEAKLKAQKKSGDEQRKKEARNKKQLFLESKFKDAEQSYNRGRLKTAALKFKNIYNFAPETEIGVRANFRSADAHYQMQSLAKKKNNDRFVIQEYQAAIASALEADLGYDYIPRAFYNIGRSYLNLKLYSDAFNQFDIIRKDYPESPFSKNALLQQGKIHLNMFRYEQAVEALQKFIDENPSAPQVPEAYYKIGESQFHLKRYKGSKTSFDHAWSLDGEYMKHDPELMFYMGEAYFINQEYQTARSIYEQLMELYPTQSFSDLVAIRIGDFLRAEEKDTAAIKAYERAIVKYTKDLLLIGKLRIANILAEKAKKGEHKKALDIYNFIIKRYPLSNLVEEAALRRALTLSLFHYFSRAIGELEEFCHSYPDNIYVSSGILHNRILETIKDYIEDYYYQGKYLDALGVFEQYEEKYYLHPMSSKCFHSKVKIAFGVRAKSILDRAPLFLIADSYYRLGLKAKALDFFEIILKDKKDPHNPLIVFNKGRIYDSKKEPEKAYQVYTNFLTEYPDHILTSTAKKALGDSYFKAQKPDRIERSIRIYSQTIRDYQNSDDPLSREIVPACWFALGNLYQGVGKYNKSISAYKNVLNSYEHPLQDKNVTNYIKETHYIMGNVFMELNQLPEAMQAYSETIRLFPDSAKAPWAKYQIGQIFVKSDKKEKALKVFKELVKQAEKYPDVLWGPLAKESYKVLLNDIKFNKYLNRTPSAEADKL
jgi:tetratricopeptide (TPR) repeat protein